MTWLLGVFCHVDIVDLLDLTMYLTVSPGAASVGFDFQCRGHANKWDFTVNMETQLAESC